MTPKFFIARDGCLKNKKVTKDKAKSFVELSLSCIRPNTCRPYCKLSKYRAQFSAFLFFDEKQWTVSKLECDSQKLSQEERFEKTKIFINVTAIRKP